MNYLIAFPAEIQAQQLLEPYGYAHILPRPAGQTWDDYAWNQSNAILRGAKIILSYKDGTSGLGKPIRVPVYESTYFWVSLLTPAVDDALFNRFAGQPIIEFGDTPKADSVPPYKPHDYVRRANHLSFTIDAIAGISPVWAGQPDMGFRGDTGA